VGAGSNATGQRPPAANTAYFHTVAPFIRKHRLGARGGITALAEHGAGELMLAASELRRCLRREDHRAA